MICSKSRWSRVVPGAPSYSKMVQDSLKVVQLNCPQVVWNDARCFKENPGCPSWHYVPKVVPSTAFEVAEAGLK